ncbi:M28 family peptidase [Allomuricauda sp. d1]|uniref:M28 family peptidase n=1 Tax=Allomuricauda sp. d1 TaxID=3136725 RepID=UPI0031D1650A
MTFSRTLAFFLLFLAAYLSYRALMPQYPTEDTTSTEFSADRALVHVKNISREPHAVGFEAHETVRQYILSELKKLGLETSIQSGYTAGDWANLSKATNILARINGTGQGKALLLLSHYDSSPHSSFGASDAGSGVATILEGVRAFLSSKKIPKNDIIILISDAEELGLNGADLFVNNHPWAKDVGLVLNFEARGSGGPSYMLIETNRGNAKLLKEFVAANPKYPVANSLAYSIYKMLPNDTDLTVFREDGDIDGFNFAFIDDHYDYHTALDTYQRLDRNSLLHQGSYLMPLLNHFSQEDISDLKSPNDHVYFNMPFFRMISYPFEWIWPLFLLAVVLFIVFMVIGFKKGTLNVKSVLLGFVPFIVALLVNGFLGYVSWPILKWWYPGFNDMLHGFTYNGHFYIYVIVFMSLGICFLTYHKVKKTATENLLIAPIIIWLLICALANVYLKGASFFIVPVFGLIAGLLVHVNQKEPNPYLLAFLAVPAVFMIAPFLKMFPVGLGLKMLVATSIMTTLLFALALPLMAELKHKARFGILFLLLMAIFGIASHLSSGFNEKRPKPSSLLYVYDEDNEQAIWATYDKRLIGWNSEFLQTENIAPSNSKKFPVLSSKYSTGFSYTAEVPIRKVATPLVEATNDTVIGQERHIDINVTPQRDVNRLEVFTNDITVLGCSVNEVPLSEHYLKNRRSNRLVTHYISDNSGTQIAIKIPKEQQLKLSFHESSHDLLHNTKFRVPNRPVNSIPMPFVLNDAIMTVKTLTFE